MRGKIRKKSTKYFVYLAILNLSRYFIRVLKKITKNIYQKIDWIKIENKNVKSDPQAEKWAKVNLWFGYDEAMTNFAFKLHRELTEFEGISPKSKKYYEEIDKRMYDQFKDRFVKYYSMEN